VNENKFCQSVIRSYKRQKEKQKMTLLGKNFRHGEATTAEDSRPLLADMQLTRDDSEGLSESGPPSSPDPRDSTSINMAQPSSSKGVRQNDFMFIKIVARITLQVVSIWNLFNNTLVFVTLLECLMY